MTAHPYLTAQADSVTIVVRVQPKASHSRVVGICGAQLKIAVTEPAEGGKANAAVIALLAKVLGLPRTRLELVSGQTSRTKRIRVHGLSITQAAEALQNQASAGER